MEQTSYVERGFKSIKMKVGKDFGKSEREDIQRLAVAPHAYQLIHLHLTCATPNLKIVEYLGMAEVSDRIVYKEWSEPKDGMWSPDPNKPGLGLELDPEAVEKYAVGADAPRTQL